MGTVTIKGGLCWTGEQFVDSEEMTYAVREEADWAPRLHEDDLIIPGGLIDMHTHLWAPPAVHSFGVASECYYATGIAGAVDAGTYGVNDWEAANRYWKSNGCLQLKSYLSVLPEGLTVFPPVTPTRPERIDVQRYVDVIQRNRADALGMKVQLGWLNYKSEKTDTELLEICRKVADQTQTHVMVHISGQCMRPQDSAKMLRAGDIITHPYSGFANTVLDASGSVYPELFEATQRGVLLDVGYAGKHFSWKVFEKAHAQGLAFETMGADLATVSYRTPKSIIVDQFHMLSGFLNFGIDTDTVFRALTTTPARLLGFELNRETSCLVLQKVAEETAFIDGQGDLLSGTFEYRPMAVIQQGRLLQIEVAQLREKRRIL